MYLHKKISDRKKRVWVELAHDGGAPVKTNREILDER